MNSLIIFIFATFLVLVHADPLNPPQPPRSRIGPTGPPGVQGPSGKPWSQHARELWKQLSTTNVRFTLNMFHREHAIASSSEYSAVDMSHIRPSGSFVIQSKYYRSLLLERCIP